MAAIYDDVTLLRLNEVVIGWLVSHRNMANYLKEKNNVLAQQKNP
jgi:hypothetical protein